MRSEETEYIATQLLSVIPFVLGYRPRESLVILPFDVGGGQLSFGAAVRIDFGFAEAGVPPSAFVDCVSALRRTSDCPSVLTALYCADIDEAVLPRWPEREHGEDIYSRFAAPLDALCGLLRFHGFDVMDPWWVSATGFGSFRPGLHVGDIAELDDTHSTRQLRSDGTMPYADFAAATALPVCDPQVEKAIERARSEEHSQSRLADAFLAEALRYAEAADAGVVPQMSTLPAPDPLAVLGFECLSRTAWGRDALQMLVSFEHSAFLAEDMRRLDPGEFAPYAEAVASAPESAAELPGFSLRRPDPVRAQHGLLLLKMMATYVSMEQMATVFAMKAWLEWTLGRVSFAVRYARTALTIDAEQRLASLVAAAVQRGLDPGWIRIDRPRRPLPAWDADGSGSGPLANPLAACEPEYHELSPLEEELGAQAIAETAGRWSRGEQLAAAASEGETPVVSAAGESEDGDSEDSAAGCVLAEEIHRWLRSVDPDDR